MILSRLKSRLITFHKILLNIPLWISMWMGTLQWAQIKKI